jgi:hypothetical protein
MPIFGSFGANPARSYGVFGGGKPNAVASLTATNVPSGRAFNNGRIDLSWSAPGNNGVPITGYKIERSTDNTTFTTLEANTGTSSTSYQNTGLNSSQIYYYKVSAINAVGIGDASTSSSATATTVPQAPTIGAVTAGYALATVAYTAGATGGAAVSAYTATSSPGSVTGTGASPITVSGLTNGTAYTFTVTATNANGTSAASAASSSVTPNFPASDSDNFNRTTSGNLGSTSGATVPWTGLTGTWFANGSQAQSNDSFATAILRTPSSYGTVQSGTVTPGVGLVYWATDSNNLIASYPFYSSSTVTNTVCGAGPSSGCIGYNCTPSNCCSGVTNYCQSTCPSICGPIFGEGPAGGCISCAQLLADWGGGCVSNGPAQYRERGICSTNGSVSTTTSTANIRTFTISSGTQSVIDTYQVQSTTGSVSPINSMRVQTANSTTANIYGWTGTGFSGTQYSRTLNPSGPRSTGYGLIKNTSGSATGASQGSTADDFALSGF